MKVGDIIAVDLPPEPRVGTVVRDRVGDVWQRTPGGWQDQDDADRGTLTWPGLLIRWVPLTVVAEAPPMPEPPEETLVRHAGRIFGRLTAPRTMGKCRWRIIRGTGVTYWITWEKLLELDPHVDPEILEV